MRDELTGELRHLVAPGAAHIQRRGHPPRAGGEQSIAAADVVDLDVAQVDGHPSNGADSLLFLAQALQAAYPDQSAAELQLVADGQQPAAQRAGHHRARPRIVKERSIHRRTRPSCRGGGSPSTSRRSATRSSGSP